MKNFKVIILWFVLLLLLTVSALFSQVQIPEEGLKAISADT